jgi:hypothetical protein
MSLIVGEGPDRYFSRADGTSSWTVNADELDSWISSLEAKAEAQEQHINNVEFQLSNPAISARNLISKTLKSELKQTTRTTTGDWAVKLHSDTGQIFYENTVTADSSWYNPLIEASESPLAQIFADNWVEWDDRREEEVERTAGFDALVDRSRFEAGELKFAHSRLDKWLGRRGIEVTEADSLSLKWAEYANVERKINKSESVEVWVNVEDFPQVPQNLLRLEKLNLASTVREMHELLFNRAHKKTDQGVFGVDSNFVKNGNNDEIYERYVYKVVGCTDYLIHQNFSLGHFDHIATCNARRMRIELCLVKLSDSDALDLQERINESVRSVKHAMHAHHMHTDDDDFRADRNEQEQGFLSRSLSSAWDSTKQFPLESINWSFRCMVRGISGLNSSLPEGLVDPSNMEGLSVCVQVSLCSNGNFMRTSKDQVISDKLDWETVSRTQYLSVANGGFDQEWPLEWLTTNVKMRNIPASARICLRVVMKKPGKPSVPIAGVALPLVSYQRKLISGTVKVHMWPSEEVQTKRDKDIAEGEKDPQFLSLESRPLGENPERNTGLLHLTFDTYELPVISKKIVYNDYRDRLTLESQEMVLPPSMPPTNEEAVKLKVIEQASPLKSLSDTDRQLVFKCRDWVSERPSLLPRLVEAVDWSDPRQVEEGRMTLVRSEEHIKSDQMEMTCLQLLDVKYGDPVVREFAVRQLDRLNDCQLAEVLLQMTQVLKYEPEHDSPLARMLLRRAIRSPLRLGQPFFWMLRSEMHLHCINDRYGLLIKLYLQRCGPHKTTLSRQLFINDSLTSIAQAVHNVRPKKAQKYNEFVQRELKKLELPAKFSLCHAPRVELTGIVIEKAGVMTSKKLPLRLDFVNADPHARNKYRALFKCGDDLRQDLLTLQVLSVMERLWIDAGMQPRMLPYACTSAGDQLGFIEWVMESTTTAWVQTHYGGKYGALKKENMRKHIAAHNKSTGFEVATMNFIASCASYCVATYVLGIGDRHSDNIMVKENGMLFHIDFGHFLGNFKSKFGVKRERDNFVFTPDFCYVMGGAYVNNFGNVVEGDDKNLFACFDHMCGKAFNVLRENMSLLMTLFVLMIPAGMPELTSRNDVAFIDEKLMLSATKEESAKHFSKEIKNALNTITRRMDNLAHTVKHYK